METEEDEEDEERSEWDVFANDCVSLHLVEEAAEMKGTDTNNGQPAMSFHPELTHQIFDDERILGFKNPRVDMYYASDSLYSYMSFEYDELTPDPQECRGVTDVGAKIKYYLEPPDNPSTTSRAKFIQVLESSPPEAFTPPGTLLEQYDLSDNETVEIYKGQVAEPHMRAYHARLQLFNLWYIDGARYIESGDPKWHIYLAFRRRRSSGRLSLAGWITAYPFFSYPQSLRTRISQVLVLPPFQGRGLCAQLLRAVYRDQLRDERVADLTVEDPSPTFQRLRDVVDLKNLCREFAPLLARASATGQLPPLHGELEQSIRKRLKLWKGQIRRCYEVLRFALVNRSDEEGYRAYRLYVKARLYHRNEETLSGIENPVERKRQLDILYRELEKEYGYLLDILRKSKTIP